ncbi:MAG: CtpF protein [Rhodospirillales bacterium]|nr:CtpF protein [Rhodospirillales bacterium]
MRSRVRIEDGGIDGATEHYTEAPTPALLIVESSAAGQDELVASLERLSEVCQPDTRVIVLGAVNDVFLYRTLRRQGVSEYLPVPVDAKALAESVFNLYAEPGSEKLGRLISFIGACGGAGASQLAHNVAFQLARIFDAETALLDFDLAFGTVSLDFNLESPQHMAAVLAEPERIDDTLLQRFMAKYGENLYLLTAPGAMPPSGDVAAPAAEVLLGRTRRNTNFVVADLPSVWTAWTQAILNMSDEIVIVAPPRLTALRNAKRLTELLNARRVNDTPARIVLNRVGASPKTELTLKDFTTGIGQEPLAVINNDPGVFELASNNGQMIGEGKSAQKVVEALKRVAITVSGRSPQKPKRKGIAEIFRLGAPKRAAAAR